MSTVEQRVLPLVAGDHMSREEFMRRWEAHPEIEFAELIGGVVFMPSPVSIEHGDTDGEVGTWLGYYRARTPNTASGRGTTTFLLGDAPQPDLNLRIQPGHGGRSRREGKYLGGIPELLAEICYSSKAYDLHEKLELYQAAQVPEYLAVLVAEQEIRWHALNNGIYQLLPSDAAGVWRSTIYPGLWLDGPALLAGNMVQVLAKLDEGLATPEHRAFVEKLNKAH